MHPREWTSVGARRGIVQLALAIALCGAAGPATAPAPEADPVTFTEIERSRLLQYLPPPPPPEDPTNRWADSAAAATLGQRLFFETRLSSDRTFSCATCHEPARFFTDGRSVAQGRVALARNTPTVVNAAHQRWLFWDGRVDSLWAQAMVPIESPQEQGGDRVAIVRLLCADAVLRREYEAAIGPLPGEATLARLPLHARPDGAGVEPEQARAWAAIAAEDRDLVDRVFANAAKSIAAYERRLLGGPAPFDRFIEGLRNGDEAAITALPAAARRGAKLFVGEGNCRLCHSGPMFSDGEFHSVGAPPRAGSLITDPGRFAGAEEVRGSRYNAKGPFSDLTTGAAADEIEFLVNSPASYGQFRTPSLRNVALTPPYMHAGQFATLREVIRHYATLEGAVFPGHHRETILRPLGLTDDQVADLEAFLESLSGTPPAPDLLAAPPAGLDSTG